MGRHKEAEAALSEAIRVLPSASEARYHRGRLFLDQGSLEAAAAISRLQVLMSRRGVCSIS